MGRDRRAKGSKKAGLQTFPNAPQPDRQPGDASTRVTLPHRVLFPRKGPVTARQRRLHRWIPRYTPPPLSIHRNPHRHPPHQRTEPRRILRRRDVPRHTGPQILGGSAPKSLDGPAEEARRWTTQDRFHRKFERLPRGHTGKQLDCGSQPTAPDPPTPDGSALRRHPGRTKAPRRPESEKGLQPGATTRQSVDDEPGSRWDRQLESVSSQARLRGQVHR